MPPKPKYTRDEIITASFEIARTEGIERVVAREVGKKLGTSTSPIFTFFDSIDELKNEVMTRAKQCCREYMEHVFEYHPAFKEFGIRWVRFAVEEPKLYTLLTRGAGVQDTYLRLREDFSDMMKQLVIEIEKEFSINDSEAEWLFMEMLTHANGIAAFYVGATSPMNDTELSRSLSNVCLGLLANIRLRNGTFDVELARRMAVSAEAGTMPQRIRK